MANSPRPTLSVGQALETLNHMQQNLPPPVAEQLAEVSAVLQNLSADNAYLNTLLLEGEAPPPAALPAAPPAPAGDRRTLTGLLRESAADPNAPLVELFAGLNDALRPPLIVAGVPVDFAAISFFLRRRGRARRP